MKGEIRGGALWQGASLCATCLHSTIIRGQKPNQGLIRCHAGGVRDPLRITFIVTSCSDYMDVRLPPAIQLIEPGRCQPGGAGKRPAGFIRQGDLGKDRPIRTPTDPNPGETR